MDVMFGVSFSDVSFSGVSFSGFSYSTLTPIAEHADENAESKTADDDIDEKHAIDRPAGWAEIMLNKADAAVIETLLAPVNGHQDRCRFCRRASKNFSYSMHGSLPKAYSRCEFNWPTCDNIACNRLAASCYDYFKDSYDARATQYGVFLPIVRSSGVVEYDWIVAYAIDYGYLGSWMGGWWVYVVKPVVKANDRVSSIVKVIHERDLSRCVKKYNATIPAMTREMIPVSKAIISRTR